MKLSNNQLKYLQSLHDRKYRQKYHNFIVEGVKIAGEVLADGRLEVEQVIATPEWLAENAALLPKAETLILPVSEAELKKASLLTTPNQVMLVVRQTDHLGEVANISKGLSLYLDDIRDPGNLGTLLRIADWFGIPWVVCSPECVEANNPKVVQASMGAFLRVKCVEMSFAEIKELIPDLPIYGTVLDGAPLHAVMPTTPAVIAIGNESRGLSLGVQAGLTHRISIPRGTGGGAESLNAAVAAGIVCHWAVNSR